MYQANSLGGQGVINIYGLWCHTTLLYYLSVAYLKECVREIRLMLSFYHQYKINGIAHFSEQTGIRIWNPEAVFKQIFMSTKNQFVSKISPATEWIFRYFIYLRS